MKWTSVAAISTYLKQVSESPAQNMSGDAEPSKRTVSWSGRKSWVWPRPGNCRLLTGRAILLIVIGVYSFAVSVGPCPLWPRSRMHTRSIQVGRSPVKNLIFERGRSTPFFVGRSRMQSQRKRKPKQRNCATNINNSELPPSENQWNKETGSESHTRSKATYLLTLVQSLSLCMFSYLLTLVQSSFLFQNSSVSMMGSC